MITTHRFGILSNHIVELDNHEHGTNWGLRVANRGSHFRVLTVHEYNGKTLILFLHLPDVENWKIFQNVKLKPVEDNLIANCIKCFEINAI